MPSGEVALLSGVPAKLLFVKVGTAAVLAADGGRLPSASLAPRFTCMGRVKGQCARRSMDPKQRDRWGPEALTAAEGALLLSGPCRLAAVRGASPLLLIAPGSAPAGVRTARSRSYLTLLPSAATSER